MGLEIIMLSEVNQEEKDKHHITYMWNLKYDTNKLIYKTETDPQREHTCGFQGEGGWGRVDWESGVSRWKLLYREWITRSYCRAQGMVFHSL